MNALLLVAALSAWLAGAVAVRPSSRVPPGDPALAPEGSGVLSDAGPADRASAEQGPSTTSAGRAVAAGLLAGGAVMLLLGGAPGVTVGAGVATGVPLVIAHLEPAATRRDRLAVTRAAPLVAELLAAALLAGVPMDQALPVVARAVGGPAGHRLLAVHRRLALGEPPGSAFHALARSPGLGAIARAVLRSSRTGAPLAALLTQAAGDLRAEATAAGLEQVRGTAVRAVLPLGLCLLPAFALLGIVPIVGGLLPDL